MSGFWLASYVTLWLLFLALAFAFVSMLRNMGELADAVKRLSAPRETITLVAGEAAPILVLHMLDGQAVSSVDIAKRITTFALISPGCRPCQTLIHALATGNTPDVFPTRHQRIILSTSSIEDTRTILAKEQLPPDITILIDAQKLAAERWGARSTPTFITLDERGRYLKHTVGFMPPATPAGAMLSGQS